MPVLLFRLNDVPDDEAQEVRALLHEHGLAFYESDAGRWGISVAGIWLRDEADAARATELLADYQRERRVRVQDAYRELRREGRHDTLWRRLRRRPLQVVFYLLAILAVLYLSIVPLVDWG